MKELLKRTYEIFIQRHWLRCIEKEINKYEEYKQKTSHQAIIVHEMTKRYNEIYRKEVK